MTKVHPCKPPSSSSSSSSSSFSSTERSGVETYTIWMKSLVGNGNGFTVYDSNGKVVYRMDNYSTKSCKQVYLMDFYGNVLFSMFRKKIIESGLWNGYRCNTDTKLKSEKPCFEVKNCSNFWNTRDTEYRVTMGCDDPRSSKSCYTIKGMAGKSEFDIINQQGSVVAEIKQKQSSSGVVLGQDVLSLKVDLMVEDQSLIMALVAIYALLTRKM